MGGQGWWLLAASLAAPAQAQDFVRIAHPATADTVRQALDGAARRLERDVCSAVLDEFRDLAGRPLREALERAGETPAGHLRRILFYDGSEHAQCRNGRALAITQPGSHAVQVCPEAIRSRYRRDPRYVEVILIHEALHTLGLGENPPSSVAITKQVMRRCSR
jgi:hypothetical protein